MCVHLSYLHQAGGLKSVLFSFKQTYAMLDWQNSEQRPAKAPDNEWFTVQYSEVRFDGNK